MSGRIPEIASSLPTTVSYGGSTVDRQKMIAKFWDLKTCHVNRTHSFEETAYEEFSDEEGRFVVNFPKKEHMLERLGVSRVIAMKRFIGLEKWFIKEYILMVRMKEIYVEQGIGDPVCTTTKLRVMFDVGHPAESRSTTPE